MSKLKEVRLQIEMALFNPPNPQQMLNELRMEGLHLKHRGGDIALFQAINHNLVERLWKVFKVNQIISLNGSMLEKAGINTSQMLSQAHRLIIGSDEEVHQGMNLNPNDGFLEEGYLELEVFHKSNQAKN